MYNKIEQPFQQSVRLKSTINSQDCRLQNNTGGTDLEEIGKEQIKERIPAIQVRNLYKVYRVGETKVYALNGVDFTMYKGEFCAIVGTSGSGKSTLLNMLAGLEKPTKGEIVIAGKHIEKLNENQLVSFRRERVGFIFQSYNLLNTMNAVENIALPLSYFHYYHTHLFLHL